MNEPRRRLLLVLGRGGVVLGVLLAGGLLAGPAAAHDNLGGDEMSMAFWMFAFSMGIVMTGIFALWWAWRGGMFTNIEEPKYRMLEDAPDLDLLEAPAPQPVPRPEPPSVPAVEPQPVGGVR